MCKKIKFAIYCFGILFLNLSAYGKNYYFSSSSGDDSYTEAQAQNSSTPWKSIDKLNSIFTSLQAGDSVLLKRGDIFYGALVLKNSGTSGSPIVIGAYASGSKPVITGLKTLTSWTSIGNGIYETYNAAFGTTVNSLVFDGQAREMGRWPKSSTENKGYRTISSAVSNTSITDNSLSGTPNWTGAEVVIRKNRWTIDRNKITSHAGSTIDYITGNYSNAAPGYGYFIQNHINTLTELGDWYYNPSTQKMNVFFGSAIPSSFTIKASSLKNIVHIANQSYITITDIVLEGGNDDTFRVKEGGKSVIVKNCEIRYSGINGVEVSTHTNFLMENCHVSNSNSVGIKISSSSQYAVIRNNTVENTGIFAGMGLAVGHGFIGIQNHGDYGIIEYNRVINSGYNGIQHKFVHNKIRYNYVDTFCFLKDDGGGIYGHNAGNQNFEGTQIIGNIVINGIGAKEGTTSSNPDGIGIYMDDNANGVEVTGNTVANCFRGIYIHNARNSVITKNTLYNNTSAQLMGQNDGVGDEIVNLRIEDNILFAKESQQLASSFYSSKNLIEEWGYFNNNFYCRPIKDDYTIKYRHTSGTNETITLESWKTKYAPYDSNSKKSPLDITDPETEIRFEYNATPGEKTVSLDAVYTDVKGTRYTKVTLQPFTSIVLIKDPTANPEAPTVVITSPADGATVTASTPLTIKATASDTDGSVAKVEFYNGTTKLGEDLDGANGWAYAWSSVPVGSFFLTAKAIDNGGFSTSSSAVKINVAEPAVLSAPANLTAQWVSGSQINLSWEDKSSDEAEFVLERATNLDFTGSVARITIAANSTVYEDQNKTAGINFYYRIKAVKATESSPYSNVASAEASNQTPVVDGGIDKTIMLPTNTSSFTATASDPDGSVTTYLWEKINGPSATLEGATSATLLLSNLIEGSYTFNITVTDDKGTVASDQVNLTVNPAAANNTIPVANAGPDQYITLPTNSVTLNGSGTDDDGTISRYTWSLESGPGAVSFSSNTVSSPTVSGMLSGTYIFSLTVTDDQGELSLPDQVSVAVSDAPATLVAPSYLTAQWSSSQQVDLNWNDGASDEDGFVLERATKSDFTGSVDYIRIDKNMVSYKDQIQNTKKGGGTFYYRIKATKGTLSSDYSNAVTPTLNSTSGRFVDSQELTLEPEFVLKEPFVVYPNPSSDKATIQFVLPEGGNYSLSLYDGKGALISLLQQGQAEAGRPYTHQLNSSRLSKGGLYLILLQSQEGTQVIKLLREK